MKTIEQETKDIPLELREMRLKKLNLSEELNRLSNEEFATRENINKNKKTIVQLANDMKELNKKLSGLKALCKVEEKRFAGIVEKISKELKKPELLALEADEKSRKVAGDLAKLDQDKAEHKDRIEALELLKSKVSARLTDLKNKIGEVAENDSKLKTAIAEYNAKTAELGKQKDEVNNQLNKAKELKEKLQAKTDRYIESQNLLDQKIKANDLRVKTLEDKRDEYEKRLIILTEKEKEAEGKKISFEKAYDALEEQKKEQRIKELRFQKLVKSKNLTKELEELEKETD